MGYTSPLYGLGVLSIMSLPVTGALGLFGGVACIIAAGFHQDKLDKGPAEKPKKSKAITPEVISPARQSYSSYGFPESPETAIARRAPRQTANFLNRYSKRKSYEENLRIGCEVAKNYLNKLSQSELEKITRINIFPEQETKFFGIPLRRKSLQIKIEK